MSFGEWDSHPFFVTHTGILTSNRSNSPLDLSSAQLERSPTAYAYVSPGTSSAQCHSTSELLRTL